MISRRISIRAKLLLATLATVVLLLILLLAFLDASHRISYENSLLESRSSMLSEMRSLEYTFHLMVVEQEHEMLSAALGHIRKLESHITAIESHESIVDNEQMALKNQQVLSTLGQLSVDLRVQPESDTTRLFQARTDMVVLGGLMDEVDHLLAETQEYSSGKFRIQTILALGLIAFLIGVYFSMFSINLTRALDRIISFSRQMKSGILPPPMAVPPGDEFENIASNLNALSAQLQDKINYISSLSREAHVEKFEPESEDELGNALLTLSDTLSQKELDKITRNREDKKQNWISEGVAQLGEVLRTERKNVNELSFAIIQKLVKYMNVEMGSLFITNNDDPQNPFLELSASYAYDRRKYESNRLEWGEGLPGTCALEKKKIFLTDVPDTYFQISSGTSSVKPNCLLLVPMMIAGEVNGIIELATVRLIRPFEIEFVESLAQSIASTLQAVQTNERTSQLLAQSQAGAVELKERETALLENMKQLEEAQSESGKKESEFAGTLGAMNQIVLVAELGLNGRYTSINDGFLLALESHRDQILGKMHSEFANVDPYSEEYKSFWADLRKGTGKSNTEMYKLFSGKEIWLRQTFSPILNQEGKVIKVLKLAVDVTETRSLQEKLESSKQEITRSGLDMQTLKEAVNSALIKCEMDSEGIIMDVNENYTKVTGYGRKEVLGRNYRLFLKDSEKEQFEKIW
jgi:PAS domain S-box-containing protein